MRMEHTAMSRIPCSHEYGIGARDPATDTLELTTLCAEEYTLDQVITEDCIRMMSGLPEASFDIAIADPPYNLSTGGHWEWDSRTKLPGFGGDWKKVMETWDSMPLRDYFLFTLQWLTELKRIVKPTGSIWIHGTYHNIGVVNMALQILGIEIINEIVWFKRNSFPNLSGRRLTASHETILWAHTGTSKKRQYQFNYDVAKILDCPEDQLKERGKQLRTVWDIPNNKAREELRYGKHPTQKPLRLLMRMLAISTSPGQFCLVPFAGAGSECVAAKRSGLHYLAFEIDPQYTAICQNRLAAEIDLFSPPPQVQPPSGAEPPTQQPKVRVSVPPVIKWSGSKRSQAAQIAALFPCFDRYFEPFLGGGALLYLAATHDCHASDIYKPLIDFWLLVKGNVDSLIEHYAAEWKRLQEDLPGHFYVVRDRFNANPNPYDLCFLSRTCVNGIIRFNDKGAFNNSFHLSRKGMLPERFAVVARKWASRLKRTVFSCGDFEQVLLAARQDDFVYLDPPYAGSTNRYQDNLDQERLLHVLDKLSSRGVKWALSFDGLRGEEDLRQSIPAGLYKRHLLLESGHSFVKKVLSGNVQTVQESLYLNY
jgi:site-specific DNA-methyltransferase (adenine-specific)